MNDEVISRIADAIIALQDQENTMLPTLRQQLKECEKAIENMLSAIEAGIISSSTKKRLEELEARREELNISAEELTERFVRGDASRNTEGSGLGLNIAQSLMRLQHGSMEVTVDGDLFKVTLIFPTE